jgi:transcription elongation factor GreA
MTVTVNPASRQDVLSARLASLRAEREQALAETIPAGAGDMADRATNVDGHVRLAVLEQRIATVEDELAAIHRPNSRSGDDVAAVGDIVTIDLDDGPESFLLASLDEVGDRFDVITPSSPLGRALQGHASARPFLRHRPEPHYPREAHRRQLRPNSTAGARSHPRLGVGCTARFGVRSIANVCSCA